MSRHCRTRKLSNQPVSQTKTWVNINYFDQVSVLLYIWMFLFDLFGKNCVPMGVFIFAETFGICVKHSSGNSLLKFLTRHKYRGEILFEQKCKFLSKHSNNFVKLSSNISLLKFLPQQNSEGKSFILTKRESIFSNYV